MRQILLLLLLCPALLAQQALRLDLSGDWRMIANEDRPEFASPDFDDSRWPLVRIPTHRRFPSQIRTGWMRLHVHLPSGTDRTQLALTLGSIQRDYKIYVNGRLDGASPTLQTEDAEISRPRTFFLSAVSGDTVLIAIRLQGNRSMNNLWRMPDQGPYLLTNRMNAPENVGVHAMERHKAQLSPMLGWATLYLGLALLSLAGWLGERRHRALLWFSLFAVGRMAVILLDFELFGPASHPFRHGLELLLYLCYGILFPLFGEVVLHALDVRLRWQRWALWLVWAEAPLAYVAGWREYESFRTTNQICIWLTLAFLLWQWRGRRSGADHLMRAALVAPVLQNLTTWNSQLLGTGSLAAVFEWHGYLWSTYDLFQIPVCTLILARLVRRTMADRQEQQRLAGELEAARAIQSVLLREPRMPGSRVEAVTLSANEVGGDFYAVLDEEVLLVGDVSGKGLKAAMMVSLILGVSRGISVRRPGQVLEALNRVIAERSEGGFVTCLCAHFGGDGQVTIANAGHVAPYRDGEELPVRSSLPLGLDPDVVFEEEQFETGGQLTFLSDGVVEATNAAGELFGFERTAGLSTRRAAEIAEAARAWGQNDDITVVTVGNA